MRRIRQNIRADVPPVHDDVVLRGHLPLQLGQPHAHRRMGRNGGRCHGQLRCAQPVGHVLTGEQHALSRIRIPHRNLRARQRRADRFRIVYRHAPPQAPERHGAVHGAGIQISDAEPRGHGLCDGALSGARRTVDGNVQSLHTLLLPANAPVDHAI